MKKFNSISPVPQSSLSSSPTEFHGVVYTLQDGTVEFMPAHPEIKEQIELLINGK